MCECYGGYGSDDDGADDGKSGEKLEDECP
jgi:hypothetical protein